MVVADTPTHKSVRTRATQRSNRRPAQAFHDGVSLALPTCKRRMNARGAPPGPATLEGVDSTRATGLTADLDRPTAEATCGASRNTCSGR